MKSLKFIVLINNQFPSQILHMACYRRSSFGLQAWVKNFSTFEYPKSKTQVNLGVKLHDNFLGEKLIIWEARPHKKGSILFL